MNNGKVLGLTPTDTLIVLTKYYRLNWPKIFDQETIHKLVENKILNKDKSLSQKGLSYIEFMLEITGEEKEDQFKEFWDTFPQSDELPPFHLPNRNMKVKKKLCKQEYYKLLEEFSHPQIINGLKKQIASAISQSTATDNRLKFVKNSDNWLKDRDFLIYMGQEEAPTTNDPLPNVS